MFSLLVGCVPNSKIETVSITPSPSSTPIITPTATQPPSPTFTPTSITIPSHPISTPSAKENTEITLELLRTNNGCDLLCWWGIIPNQTSWSDAKKFLKQFSTIYERQPPSEWFVYDIHSPLPLEFSEVYAVRTVYAIQEGIVKEIEAGYFDEKTYHISSFLKKNGVPTRILVSTYSSDSGLSPNNVPLSVDLYYPEKGINALYGTYATVTGTQIMGCLEKISDLFLWSPAEHNRSIDYILGWDKHQIPYLDIKEATDMSVQEFYDQFVNSENPLCLQTTKNLWPSQ
jgi:hypothetical protein